MISFVAAIRTKFVIKILLNLSYRITAECLRSEAKLTGEYQICDNISLETIIVDFEMFYFQRFSCVPQLCKRISNNIHKSKNSNSHKINSSSQNNVKPKQETDRIVFDDVPDLFIKSSSSYRYENCDGNHTFEKNDLMNSNAWKEYTDFVLQVKQFTYFKKNSGKRVLIANKILERSSAYYRHTLERCKRIGRCKRTFEGSHRISNQVSTIVYWHSGTMEKYFTVWTSRHRCVNMKSIPHLLPSFLLRINFRKNIVSKSSGH